MNYQRAKAAGEKAISSLNKAKDELKKAQNWGIVDLVGGGLVTSLAKRSKINHAQEFMNEAKSEIRKFSNELKYYTGTESLEIDVDDFMKFADWFFDGFVVDFMVQSKINKALEQVNDAITKIQYILRQLS